MFKIGADPELFLRRTTEKGYKKFVSAETEEGPIIPGTKANPFKVPGGAIQVDGVAAEFNVNPADNYEEFFDNTKKVLTKLRETVKKHDKSLSLVATPTATFTAAYFNKLPKHTLMLGCEPDFNAYSGKANDPPKTDKPFRTASGHVHIGWTNNANPTAEGHMMDCILVVKELDRYLHYASLDWDKDNKRRQLYGKIGAFRPKPYGLEYRVLSNAWLRSVDTIRTVYDITTKVMQSIDSGKHKFARPERCCYGANNTDRVYQTLRGY